MALSFVKYTGDGVTTQWTVTSAYISKLHIFVFVDGVSVPFAWVNDTLIQTVTAAADQSTVEVRRDTPISAPLVDFEDGGTLSEEDLDAANLQELYLAQEQADDIDNSIGLGFDQEWDFENKEGKNLATPTSPTALTNVINIDFLNTALVGSGNVPVPLDPSQDGNTLIAASGLWAWGAMVVANLSDVVAVMKTFLTSADLATARTNLGLGTAAVLNDGTGAGDLPLNSDLGTASLVNTGVASGEIPLLDGIGLPAVSANQLTYSALINAINENKGNNIASGATTDIGAATGNFVDVTGTTTITSFGTVTAGTERTVRFTGALTITHNASSLILLASANILTIANDIGIFRSLGSGNWVMVDFIRKTGKPLYAQTNGATVGDVFMVEKTVLFSDIDSGGSAILINSVGTDQFKVRDIMMEGLGINFNAGGDRLLDLTDGTTVYTITPVNSLKTLVPGRWGDTPLPYPGTPADMSVPTVAAADLVLKHSGGATDYTAGSVKIMVLVERFA